MENTTSKKSTHAAEFEGSSSQQRTLRIKTAFASVLPSRQYWSLVMTSSPLSDFEVVDTESGLINVCTKICVDGFLADVASGAPDALILHFVDGQMRAKLSFLTLLSDNAEVVSFELRLFVGSLAHSVKEQPFQLMPHRIGSYLLDNAVNAGKVQMQRVSIKVPEIEADEVRVWNEGDFIKHFELSAVTARNFIIFRAHRGVNVQGSAPNEDTLIALIRSAGVRSSAWREGRWKPRDRGRCDAQVRAAEHLGN